MRYQALRGTHPNTVKGTAEIRRRLRGRRGRARKPPPTPSQKKERWTLEEIGIPYWDAAATGIRKKKDWYNPVRDVERFQDCKEIARKVEERCQEKWAQRWEKYRTTIPENLRIPATRDALFENTGYYKGLRKAESSVAVQFRSGKNGLNVFLKQANVPGILSSRYL